MTKIRIGDHTGIDLDQVVAWDKGERSGTEEEEEVLSLFFAGTDKGFLVYQEAVGSRAFAHLHKLLLDRFAIDLAAENLRS